MRNLIILGIVAGIILLIVKFPHTMISPGELVDGHQKLNNDCFACHAPFGGIENDKCIACHKLNEIGIDTLNTNSSNKGLFHEKLANQSCTDCHADHKGINPATVLGGFKHTLLAEKVINDCVSCHQKPTDNLHDQLSNTCKNCHNTDAWKSGVKFDHNMLTNTDKNNCVACHNKPSDRLHQPLSNACSSCHQTDSWKSGVKFDHNMLTVADKNNCASCHQKPKDSFHASLKDNCNACHSTDKWTPANFEHDSYFVLDRNHNASCTTCHKGKGYETYTCYGCHEHTVNNILSEHREEGISNINNCVSCHRSGNEHDIESGEGRNNRSEGKSKKREGKHDDDDDD
jgi:hypothetical protein